MILPNLSTTKVRIKQFIIKGSIFALAFILLFILIRVLITSIFPDSSSLPKASFGKLPPISFPNNAENNNFTYSLDTITGLLPNFPKLAKVYKIIPIKPDLLALQRTQDKVLRVGFTKQGTPISKDSYQWVEQSPAKTITFNIFSSDFTFSTPYLTAENMQVFADPSELKRAIDEAQLFLMNMSLFPKDIDEEKTKTTHYLIKENTLFLATSISNTNIVRVDFLQKNIDSLPIYYPSNLTSTIYLLVGKEQNKLRVVEGHYSYKNISNESSTYGIKTASEAFMQLKQGKAYIAVKPHMPDINNISIKNVSLGYYMGEKGADFLMPVIVFQGDNFIGYISAIKDE